MIRAMPSPDLPPSVLRLLPPQAAQRLIEAWKDYLQDVLQSDWDGGAGDPDSRLKALLPPFPSPEPAPVPALEIARGPSLWLAWTSPEFGRLEPILLFADRAPMSMEVMELRHAETGLLIVATMVGTALSLEMEITEPIIRALFHQGGLWEDQTVPPE